jgi:hypothetical protein
MVSQEDHKLQTNVKEFLLSYCIVYLGIYTHSSRGL